MSIFAISDLHLSLGEEDKNMDIFSGWQNCTERLKSNWERVVSENDTVVIAGDVSWAMRVRELDADFGFLNSLPGEKIITKGNHDLWWDTVTKMNRYLAEKGFETISFLHNNCYAKDKIVICGTRGWFYDEKGEKKILQREALRLEASISEGEKTGLEPVVFLHYPPIFRDWECEEITSVLKEHNIKRVYYGHIHGSGAAGAVNGTVDGIDYRLISCDINDFTPVLVAK